MINRDQIVDATEAYILSYDTAMNRTHNPNYAIQVATIVTMTVYQQAQQNQLKPPSIEAIVLAAMMQLEKAHRGEEPEEVVDDD